MNTNDNFDLIVVGGGPAGSTLAALVAAQGHSVLLLEKEEFPRHQVGESLLPATIHGICPLLGVGEEIRRAGFIEKRGATFLWGKNKRPWTFAFSMSPKIPGPTSFAYQVRRSEFDAILLENAKKKGTVVRHRCVVSDTLQDHERVRGVQFFDEHGTARSATARYIADTSGHLSRIYQRVGERVYSKLHQNVAVYGYYQGGGRLPPPNSGNILCCAFEGGWFWYIPLTSELTSVGAVVDQKRGAQIGSSPERSMEEFIVACPAVAELLCDARRVTVGEYGHLRMRKDYSYCCTRFWSPGMLLLGDAACFVDPVFSSGVHLATYSALQAARSINSCLRDGMSEQQAFGEFEARYRREFGYFYQFLTAFYDMSEDEASYFWSARKILNSAEAGNEAFIRLVAGVGASGEPLFADSQEFLEATHAIGNAFGRASSGPGMSGDFNGNELDNVFMAGFNREIARIQLQALTGKAPAEKPLWNAGLIPSTDGLHWCESRAEPERSIRIA